MAIRIPTSLPPVPPLLVAARPVAPDEVRSPAISRFDPSTVAAPTADPTDGRAFVSAALEDIRARTAAGLRSTVVFDIDDTLTDTRGRTLEIARAWDSANGSAHFAGLTLDHVTYPPTAMARKAGLPPEELRPFLAFWEPRFFSPEAMDSDLPIEAMINLAREAAAAGAELRFLTGRPEAERAGTLAELARLGLPQAETRQLFMHQPGQGAAFKAEALQQWSASGDHLSFFITDSRSDVGLIQRLGLAVPPVLFDSPLNDNSIPVEPLTPVFPFPAMLRSLW